MFDAVPFAGAGRMVGDRDRQPGLIGETLQFTFPQANARAIAAAAIGGDQQPGGGGVALAAETAPPTSDALDREGRGIVVDPDINPARVRRDVIDPVGRYLAQFGDLEVVHPHPLGLALGAQFPTAVPEIANQFLLLGVDREGWLAGRLKVAHLGVDVFELSIAIAMAGPFARLAIGLKREAETPQQPAHQLRA